MEAKNKNKNRSLIARKRMHFNAICSVTRLTVVLPTLTRLASLQSDRRGLSQPILFACVVVRKALPSTEKRTLEVVVQLCCRWGTVSRGTLRFFLTPSARVEGSRQKPSPGLRGFRGGGSPAVGLPAGPGWTRGCPSCLGGAAGP